VPPTAKPNPARAIALVLAPFLLCAIPLILAGHDRGRAAWDQDMFHLRAIHRFSGQWPFPYVGDYESATTPGFHLALSAVDRAAGGASLRTLRLAGLLFTVGLLATLAGALARRISAAQAAALCLPLAASIYVFSSGVWLVPDSAGWWGVAAVLLLALHGRGGPRTYAAIAIALFFTVLMRQVHLWAGAVLLPLAWFGTRAAPDTTQGAADAPANARGNHARPTRLLLALLAGLPAAFAVGGFALLWHGLVPPSFQHAQPGLTFDHAGFGAAAPAIILAQLALLSPFYLGYLAPHLSAGLLRDRPARRACFTAALLGALVAVLPATSYDYEAGRSSGLWNLVRLLPTFGNRSPLVVLLAAAGAAQLALWLRACPPRARAILGTALLAFIAAQCTSRVAWPRYHEPLLLVLLSLMATSADTPRSPAGRTPWAQLVPPLVLALLLAAITVHGIR